MTNDVAIKLKSCLNSEIDAIASEIIEHGLTCRNLEILCHLVEAEHHINTTNMIINK